jgi:membrane-associated phospholipid phosphatase
VPSLDVWEAVHRVKNRSMGYVAADQAGGPSRTIGERLRTWPPPVVAATLSIAGSVVLMLVLVGIGLVITRSSLSPRIVGWDGSVERWVELHRTATLDTWTDLGSILGGTGTILGVAGIAIAVLLIRRLWYDAAFLGMGLFIEFSAFLAATTIIDRPRPSIAPLDPIPVTSSYPSGHTGAAIVTYIGLAILLSSHIRHAAFRIVIWTLASLIPIYVGVSRVYRGMHHPTDVMASVVLGAGALCFALLAVHATVVAAGRRRYRRVEAPTPRERSEVHT